MISFKIVWEDFVYHKVRLAVLVCSLFVVQHGVTQEITLPYFQDFESASTGNPGTLPTFWNQANEGSTDNCNAGPSFCRDWTVNSGGTGSNNTGPSSDHTPGGGNVNYVYVEASGNANPEVRLESPSFNLSGVSANLEFWLHNWNGNNSNSHTLQIRVINASTGAYIDGGPLASYTETNNSNWVFEQISLASFTSSGNIRIVFRWVYGGGGSNFWQHDIAIDDVNIESTITTEICDNGSDDDGDGLVDCLDTDCDGDPDCDNDNDTITDRLDQDDDNDGILDALECYSPSNLISNPGFESGDTGFGSDFNDETCSTDCGPGSDVDRGDYAIASNACACGGQSGGIQEWIGTPVEGSNFMVLNFENSGTDDLWRQTVSTTAFTEYSFTVWVLNINFSDETDPRIQLAVSTNGGSSYTVLGTSAPITEAQGWTQIGFNYINGNNSSLTIAVQNANSGSNGRDIAIDALSFIAADCDDDGDGVKNSFDLDSDNDGLYDVFESASGQSQSGGRLTGGVDSDGIPLSVSDGSGYIDYLPADSDIDGLLDQIELDSDNDGCYDAFEEQITDPENDGIAGVGIPPVDNDGLITTITYISPTLNTWQNPGEDNPGCDGDTDDDGVPDEFDLDDDNDGIPDDIENPASIDFGGTRLLLSGNGTLTSLLVGDRVLYTDAIRDCDDIFYDIVITITALSPNSSGAAEDTGINLTGTATASSDRFITFNIAVVESGSATIGFPAGTPATISDFVLEQRDIDSNNGTDATEVVGFSNTTPPDSFYFDPLTVIEQGGFNNGGGPGVGFTYFRMIPLSGATNWTANSGYVTDDDEAGVFLFYSSFSSVNVAFGQTGSSNSSGDRFTRFLGSKDCDRDGDGIPNRVDLDLDNDGIYDLYEAGHSFTTDIDNNGMIDGADIGSGANGLFDNAETTPESGNVNYAYSDSDNDGILFDFFESDSDDDNCFDTEEAGIADADIDGIAGTGIPLTNAFGIITTIVYEEPPTMNWQDPLQSCLEICDNNIDDDNDGLIDEFDPDCANYYLEAECGFPGENWVRTFDIEASNNDFQTITTGLNSLNVPPGTGADILRFTVTISAVGTYRILGRVKSASGADDSFWFRVNEGTWYKWNDWDTGGTWEWVEFSDNDDGNNPVRYALNTGSHSIDIAYREDGAGIDKLHLTINGSTPSGEGEDAINCQRSITTNLFLNYKIRNRNN